MWNWTEKKKKQKVGEAKTITPNNKLYLELLLGAVVLTGFSLLVQSYDVAFTIWTSVTCGGIASILVAWLIEVANCRQLTMKARDNREALLKDIYHVFDYDLQLLIFESAEKDHCTDAQKWHEWIKRVDKQAMDDQALIPSFVRILMVFFDDLAEQVFAVKSQGAVLLDSGIIRQEDIRALSGILNICDTARATFRSKDNDDSCLRRFSTYCGLIRGFIDNAPSLRSINDMMIEPMLYHTYLDGQDKKHMSEENQDCPIMNAKQDENEEEE